MAQQKDSKAHVEDSEHEAALTGAIALAGLFSTCVEAFGLIHPSPKWDRNEQKLLVRLGLQQARLLIWGFVLGVTSPPSSVTDRAVPRHPSYSYPDTNEPTFFGARDPRLDDPVLRTTIEQALSSIIDRTSFSTREEMMAKYGLKHPKKPVTNVEPAFDSTRLSAFRERYELLQEVAETYANVGVGRHSSMTHSSWQIVDRTKFADFIQLCQDSVDSLVEVMHVQDAVDRAMCMDIRAFGWHVIPDRMGLAKDISKLRLLQDICLADYPQYCPAVSQALENISKENNEFGMAIPLPPRSKSLDESAPSIATGTTTSSTTKSAHLQPPRSHAGGSHTTSTATSTTSKKRPGLTGLFKSFGWSRDRTPTQSSLAAEAKSSSRPASSRNNSSQNNSVQNSAQPSRNNSASLPAAPVPPASATNHPVLAPMSIIAHDHALTADMSNLSLTRTRSKSVGDIPEHERQHLALQNIPTITEHEVLDSRDVVGSSQPPQYPGPIRHDQYRGIARVETKDLHQGDY